MTIELSALVDAIKLLQRAEEISRETDPVKVALFNGDCRMLRWRFESVIALSQVTVLAQA